MQRSEDVCCESISRISKIYMYARPIADVRLLRQTEVNLSSRADDVVGRLYSGISLRRSSPSAGRSKSAECGHYHSAPRLLDIQLGMYTGITSQTLQEPTCTPSLRCLPWLKWLIGVLKKKHLSRYPDSLSVQGPFRLRWKTIDCPDCTVNYTTVGSLVM